MKTSIDHLPADKIDELHNIVQLIMQRLPAEMIILFGSFARGDGLTTVIKKTVPPTSIKATLILWWYSTPS